MKDSWSAFAHQRALSFAEGADYRLALQVTQTLSEAGHLGWFAGGCVRDVLLGREPKDYDVATDASPEEVEKLFAHTIAVGKSFGVIRVIQGNDQIEVASFRKDGLYVDGRRPEGVEYSTPEEDSARRDFTVNALFYDPQTATIYDFQNGLLDLKSKWIRAIGDPSRRFQEDHLRLLRALRFAAELDFQIESSTFQSMLQLSRNVASVSAERRRDELLKFFQAAGRKKWISAFVDLHFDEFALGVSPLLVDQHQRLDVQLQDWSSSPLRAAWCELLLWCEASGKIQNLDQAEQLLRSLRASNDEIQVFRNFLLPLLSPADLLNGPFAEVRAALWACKELGCEGVMLAKQRADSASRWNWEKALHLRASWKGGAPAPLVRASDLPHLKGRDLGSALDRAYWLQLQSGLLDKEQVLAQLELPEPEA